MKFKESETKQTWRNYWLDRWAREIRFYGSQNWKMIPIAERGKKPLSGTSGALGPFLSEGEAQEFTMKNFNIAVAAGPSNLVWIDIDEKVLEESQAKNFFLYMATPRGYAIPCVKDEWYSTKTVRAWKRDYSFIDFREDAMYELVPLSVTCMKDHHSRGHTKPKQLCVDGKSHDYRVRHWVGRLRPPENFNYVMRHLKYVLKERKQD